MLRRIRQPARIAHRSAAHRGRRALGVLLAVAVTAGFASAVLATPAGAAASSVPLGRLDSVTQIPGGALISGWTFDPNTAASITTHVDVNGKFDRAIVANVKRPDLAAAYPRYGAAHGFSVRLPLAAGVKNICVYGLNVLAGSSNPLLGCKTINLSFTPKGGLDLVRQMTSGTSGGVRVAAWVQDPDEPTKAIYGDVYIDGKYATRVLASGTTESHPGHGFDRFIPTTEGTHQVCVYGINVDFGSGNPSVGCKTIKLNFSPSGAMTIVKEVAGGKIHLTGWATDPDTTAPELIDIYDYTDTASPYRGRFTASGANTAKNGRGFDATISTLQGNNRICVYALNAPGTPGVNTKLYCPTAGVGLNYNPQGAIKSLTETTTGILVKGWIIDPDTTGAIQADVYVDNVMKGRMTANISRNDIPTSWVPIYGRLHGYQATIPLATGTHSVCIRGLNVSAGSPGNGNTSCLSITLNFNPVGRFESLTRSGSSLRVSGWADDASTLGPINIAGTIDGRSAGPIKANVAHAGIPQAVPGLGSAHGFAALLPASAAEHTVCLTAINVGGGTHSTGLGCKVVYAVHPTRTTAPQAVHATATYGAATVSFAAPANDGGHPTTRYAIKSSPAAANLSVTKPGAYVIRGLKAGTVYRFLVYSINPGGTSAAGLSAAVTIPKGPPPQTTPAPISTSRYLRNLNGSSSDLTWMKAAGAADAAANPANHSYLVLLDIGGQSTFGSTPGVVLSATSRFISETQLVAAVDAYTDGYASRQQAGAPVTIAVGTNNDSDVSAATGARWAHNVISPISSHANAHPSMRIAGANDIEPGFSAGPSASMSWLSGYLGATAAPFVFNGSADGCNPNVAGGGCNNGWTEATLQWLAGGASPTRVINLPQIYNTTMAAQWKYISLTGVVSSKPKINFGGPLTEYTACVQAGSCGSLSGTSAWTAMWGQLRSDSRIAQGSMPFSTDLRIN